MKTYGVVRCCRKWPIIIRDERGNYYDWRRCGECGTKPVLVEIDGKPIGE